MNEQTPQKLEIFLFLALRQTAQNAFAETENGEVPRPKNISEFSPAFGEQLAAPDFEEFERLRTAYLNKSETDRQRWLEQIEKGVRADGFTIDDNLHRSHVENALSRECPAVRKIIENALPDVYRTNLNADSPARAKDSRTKSVAAVNFQKVITKTFADQFVALRDLPKPTAFDRLSGARLARLARLAGIRETAFACARIESLESVGAFLRRFAPEDARAIAAQLSGLPKIAAVRLAFAESLVQNALEIESQPTSEMLDWLGIRLIGIMLRARESAARVVYAEQKLPLETTPKMSEIIETQCRFAPADLAQTISAEIEKLAVMIADAEDKIGK